MIDMEKLLGRYVWMLVQSYNPDTYISTLENGWRVLIGFFTRTLLLSLTIFIITFVPATIHYIDALPNTLEQVETFTLSADLSADHPVELFADPSVVVDTSENTTTSDYDVLITSEGIVYPSMILFGQSYARWDEIKDVKQQSVSRDRALFLAAIFLLPSIIFWYALFSILKLLLIALLFIGLGYGLPRLFSHTISLAEVIKIGILSSPSLMLIGVGLAPIAPSKLFWWGFAITAVLFGLGVIMLSERVGSVHRRARKV